MLTARDAYTRAIIDDRCAGVVQMRRLRCTKNNGSKLTDRPSTTAEVSRIRIESGLERTAHARAVCVLLLLADELIRGCYTV
jgi:hypothetical protein